MGFQVAIDGPSASGKSSIAREVAEEFNFIHINTGLMYRAMAYQALLNHIDLQDEKALGELIDSTSLELTADQKVLVNGNDVSDKLKTVSLEASTISAFPLVREKLVKKQQEMADVIDCVMDGRDIGTVVLPTADVKIFITAAIEDRVQRRTDELLRQNIECNYDEILADMIQRDYQDANRPVGALKQAEDAVLIDTTGNTFEESAGLVIQLIREHLGKDVTQ